MMTERIGSIAVSKPNILLFMADQLNGQLCPINGDPVCHMPNLQRLAGQGVNFSQARCNDPLCTPSRMSMLTDWLVSNLGCAWHNASALRSDIPTFLHMLTHRLSKCSQWQETLGRDDTIPFGGNGCTAKGLDRRTMKNRRKTP